eukprot:scaffold5199_cov199-Alexandrium_tamarense.AAC.3
MHNHTTRQPHNKTTTNITQKTVNQTISISYSFRFSTKTIYRFYQWIQSPCKGVWKAQQHNKVARGESLRHWVFPEQSIETNEYECSPLERRVKHA